MRWLTGVWGFSPIILILLLLLMVPWPHGPPFPCTRRAPPLPGHKDNPVAGWFYFWSPPDATCLTHAPNGITIIASESAELSNEMCRWRMMMSGAIINECGWPGQEASRTCSGDKERFLFPFLHNLRFRAVVDLRTIIKYVLISWLGCWWCEGASDWLTG